MRQSFCEDRSQALIPALKQIVSRWILATCMSDLQHIGTTERVHDEYIVRKREVYRAVGRGLHGSCTELLGGMLDLVRGSGGIRHSKPSEQC